MTTCEYKGTVGYSPTPLTEPLGYSPTPLTEPLRDASFGGYGKVKPRLSWDDEVINKKRKLERVVHLDSDSDEEEPLTPEELDMVIPVRVLMKNGVSLPVIATRGLGTDDLFRNSLNIKPGFQFENGN